MADIFYDIGIEHGSVSFPSRSSNPVVTCSEGKVIIAAVAWQNWMDANFPTPVLLLDASGVPSSAAKLLAVGDPGDISNPAITYQLTTAKIVSLP